MKKARVVSVGIAFVLATAFISHAQETATTVPSASADSIVSLVAETQGLELVPPEQVPLCGTFWLVSPDSDGGITAPLPCPPLNIYDDPIYAIAEGQFLVDGTGNSQTTLNTPPIGRLAPSSVVAADLQAEAEALVNLIAQIQATEANQQMRTVSRAMGMDVPSPGEDGSGEGGPSPMFSSAFTIDTNGLWLEFTNEANGMAYLNLHGSTNQVYAIASKSDLSLTNWTVETEVWPTNQAVMPFTVSVLGRTNLFLWAWDWTGVTKNGNTTPDWWFWNFFDTTDLSDTNLDSQGNMLLSDYQNNVDPNIIQFSLHFTNTYLNTPTACGSVTIVAGSPLYEAKLVNDTNIADAVWGPYTSTNITVPLNSGDGLYVVRVGLRGLSPDAAQTWLGISLTLKTVAPAFIITNPISSTVSQTMIQLQGLVDESLSKLTFDVSNALGAITNQQGCWQSVFFDTNRFQFTTNTFQCCDIKLTNGVNTITLRAMDLAGNIVTTNLNYTLSYAGVTNAPTLSIIWPHPNTPIGDSNVTIQAQVDDATANVTATVNNNTVQGLVERSGLVWLQNVPLSGGTNVVTIIATNAAGNVNTTNLTVVQSPVTLTINPIDNNQLNQPLVTVTGTVSPGQNVWVNGQQANVDDSGNWMVNVPVSPTGTAELNAQAGTDPDSPLAVQSRSQPQPAMVELASYVSSYQAAWTGVNCGDGQYNDFFYWSPISGGTRSGNGYLINQGEDDWSGSWNDPISSGEGAFFAFAKNGSAEVTFNNVGPYFNILMGAYGTYEYQMRSELMIEPSGQQAAGGTSLYLVSASALAFSNPSGINAPSAGDVPVAPENLKLNGQVSVNSGITNADGSVSGLGLVSGPSGAPLPLVVSAPASLYSFNGKLETNVNLQIIDAATGTNLTAQTNTVIVGQQMNLTCQLNVTNALLNNSLLANFQWTVPGITFSDYVATASSAVLYTNFPTGNSNVIFYWADGASNRVVQCSAMVNGTIVTGQATFNVSRPEATWTLTRKDHVAVDADVCGADFPGYYYLHTGKKCTTNDVGMWYDFQLTDLKGYAGAYEFQLVQIATIDWKQNLDLTNHPYWSKYTEGRGLDGSYPLKSWSGTFGDYNDTPWDALLDYTAFEWRQDTFESYVLFKPDGGKPVPIKLATWNWSGRAKKIGNNSPPTFVGVTPFTDPQSTIGMNCVIHPQWTNNISYPANNWTYQSFWYTTP